MTSKSLEIVFSSRASLNNGAEVRVGGGLRTPNCTARTTRGTADLPMCDSGEQGRGSGRQSKFDPFAEKMLIFVVSVGDAGGPVVRRPSLATALGTGPWAMCRSGTVARQAGTPQCDLVAQALGNQ